jgi:hypothetical protein
MLADTLARSGPPDLPPLAHPTRGEARPPSGWGGPVCLRAPRWPELLHRVEKAVVAAEVDDPVRDGRGADGQERPEPPFLLSAPAVESVEMAIVTAEVDHPAGDGRSGRSVRWAWSPKGRPEAEEARCPYGRRASRASGPVLCQTGATSIEPGWSAVPGSCTVAASAEDHTNTSGGGQPLRGSGLSSRTRTARLCSS